MLRARRQEFRDGRNAMRARAKATLPLLRAQARERVRALRPTRAPEAPSATRRRVLTAIAILLLLLLFIRCDPGQGPGVAVASPKKPASPQLPKPTPQTFHASLAHQHRPGFGTDGHPAPDWLDDFRLQVAARSPRLAQCFNGAERGGTFRWTVSVDAPSGNVANHELEPVGEAGDVDPDQKRCIITVLSNPGYKLKPHAGKNALPDRVSLVVEF